MKGAISLLVALCCCLKERKSSNCIQMYKLSEEGRARLVESHGLPRNIFKLDRTGGPHLFMNIAFGDKNKGHVYTLAYDKQDDITTKQFIFHLFLARKFPKENYFPYEVKCLTDEERNYLVLASYVPRSLQYPHKIGETSFCGAFIQDTKEVLRIYRWLENYGAVFQDILFNSFMVTEYRRISFNPLMLLYVCQAGQPCYVQTEDIAAKRAWAVKSFPLVKSPFKQDYIVLTASKELNRVFFLRLLAEYISQHMAKCKRPYEKKVNELFLEKAQFLEKLIANSPEIACSWKDLNEFVENYGKNGIAVDLVRNIKKKQIENGERRSSVSSEDSLRDAFKEEIELENKIFNE